MWRPGYQAESSVRPLAQETDLSPATSVLYAPSREWGASLASASLVLASTSS